MMVPPGKSAWPLHWHASNDEALFVLKGAGTLSLGEAQVRLRAGDYVALSPGPQRAHRLTNNGAEPLDNLLADRQAYSRPGIFPARVQALKDPKDALRLGRLAPDPVVAHLRPLLLNEEMQIVDGTRQHRLAVDRGPLRRAG
jgi:hypothetical protein